MNKTIGIIVLGITFLETVALIKGVDGVAFGSSISALVGIGAYYIRGEVDKKCSR